MIYIVALNPSIDYLMDLNHFDLGETNRSLNESILIGGKSINVAIMLHNLNVNSKVIGFIAGFTGKFIEEELQSYTHIDTEFHEVEGKTRINVKLKGIQETEINGKGSDVEDTDVAKIEKQLEQLTEEDLVVLTGSVASGMDAEWYTTISKKLSKKNIPFIVDIANDHLLDIVKYKPLLIKPNRVELETVFKTRIDSQSDLIKYGQELINKGAQYCIISLGEEGSLFFNKDTILKASVPKGELVSSVGSGDSMVAGFIASWRSNKDPYEAYRLAASCGSATAYTTHLAEKHEVYRLCEEIRIQVIKED